MSENERLLLIAAAPDLLAALTLAVEWMKQYEDIGMDEWTSDVLTATRNAIAKAKGETP